MSSFLLSRFLVSKASFPGYNVSVRAISRVTRRPKLNLGEEKDHPLRWQTHKEFRKSVGLTVALAQTKVLRNYPDYSYVDGRTTPVTSGQLEEIKRQRALAKSIVVHLKEIKFIEERHAKQQAELAAKKQEILDNKLKPKGIKLLKPEES